VSPAAFFVSLLLTWLLVYIVAPALLAFRGWLVIGGLVQPIGAVLPGFWHGVFWPDEPGNFGLLMIMLVPFPLCLVAAGLIVNFVRASGWVLRSIARH
jgi:hypothetical protein